MALKDKLMTLEDFKAVRDVDVASNSAQFTEIKADLGSFNVFDGMAPGFIPTSGTDYPTTNASYPNSTYVIVDLFAGQSLKIAGFTSANTQGRARCIVNGEIVSTISSNTANYTTTVNLSASINNGTITALKDIQIALMFLNGTVANGVTATIDGLASVSEMLFDTYNKTFSLTGTVNALSDAVDDVETNLDALEPLSNDIKTALFNLASHIGAWTDGDGQEYVDALGVALGITHEWDDGYTWLYQPTDGLLSEEDYATSNLVGQGGTETLTQNALRLHTGKPATESAGQNAIRYNFTPGTIRRFMGKISLVDVATSQAGGSPIGGGFQITITNGTNGLLNYIGTSGQYIAVEYYVGNSKQTVVTQIPVSGEHIFEAILTESGQTLKIDGNTVVNGVGLSTFYTTYNRVGVAAPSPRYVTANGVTTDIMWLAAYTE